MMRSSESSAVPVLPQQTALLYRRVSSEEQAREGLSLDAQRERTRQYALRRGWAIGGEYEDVLAGTRDDRPQYQALLAEARHLRQESKTVVVVVQWLDRFGRSVFERARCAEELRGLGVPIHSVMERGEIPELVANILAAVAQEEVNRLSERIQEARHFVRSNGWSYPGRPAWGYRRRPATKEERALGAPRTVLVVDPVSAPSVREVWQRAEAGEAIHAIARWVQSLPVDVRGSRSLSHQTLFRMLRAPVYISRSHRGDSDVLARPRMRWEPLVDDAVWQRVQQVITNPPRNRVGRHYLLTGLVRCPRCGGHMVGNHQWRQMTQYHCVERMLGAHAPVSDCSETAAAPLIDVLVLVQLVPVLRSLIREASADETALHRAWSALCGEQALLDHMNELEVRMQHIRDEWGNAAMLLVDGAIDATEYKRRRDSFEARVTEDEKELGIVRAAHASQRLPSVDVMLARAPEWLETLQGENVAARRDVVVQFVTTVVPTRLRVGLYRARVTWTPMGDALQRWYRDRVGDLPVPQHPEISFYADRDDQGALVLSTRIKWKRQDTEHLLALAPGAFDVLSKRDRAILAYYHGLEGGGWHSSREVAAHFGIPRKQVVTIVRNCFVQLLGPDAATLRYAESARDIGRPYTSRLRALPDEVLDQLPEPDRSMLLMYYGLADGRRYRHEELASKFGITRFRVRRNLAQSILTLFGAGTLSEST